MMTPRPAARITTSRVLDAIDQMESRTFTTGDVAKAMGVPEYPVRAAVAWLCHNGEVKREGVKRCFTQPVRRKRTGLVPGKIEPFYAVVYVRAHQPDFDFDAMYRALTMSIEPEPVE